MKRLTLKTEDRKLLGRKVKKLRREDFLPANIYGKGVKSKAVKIELKEFRDVFGEAGETNLVDLVIGKKKLPVLIHNVQLDPVSDEPIHADFLQVNLKEKVSAQIPIELAGESPAEKQGLGTVVQYVDEVEVEALPTDLPDKFEINLSTLTQEDDAVLVKELKVDKKKVEIKEIGEQILVKVEPPREEEEEAPKEKVEGEEGEEAEGEAREGEEAAGEEVQTKKEEKPQEKE